MFDQVKKAIKLAEDAVSELDPDVLEPSSAAELVKEFTKLENLAGAGKALAARRVAETGAWRAEGDRTPAHFIARRTGGSVSATVTLIETGKRVRDLSATEEAMRSGELTLEKAAAVASVATVVPKTERSLLKEAKTESIERLKQECRSVLAQHCEDQREKAEKIHKSRYCRTWTESDGAFRLDARLAPEKGAEVKAVLDVLTEEQFAQARRQRRKEPMQALAADALVELARQARGGSSSKKLGPKAVLNVIVDIEALNRGHVEDGEVCEIAGVGPVSVAAAKALMTDSFVKVLFTKLGKIQEVAHMGRYIPAALETAVKQSYKECVIDGCHETKGLQIDHTQGLAQFGLTKFGNLKRMCGYHHGLKTYKGYELEEVKGKWNLVQPKTRAGPTLI